MPFSLLENPPDLQFVKGIGPQIKTKLGQLGVTSITDFLYFFPRAYDDRRQLPKISQLKIDELLTTVGEVRTVEDSLTKASKSIIKARVEDETGVLVAVWFNQKYLLRTLVPGKKVIIRGKLQRNKFTGQTQFMVSETEFLTDPASQLNRILPLYPLSAGLHQSQMRKIATAIVGQYAPQVVDPLPEAFKQAVRIVSLADALSSLHFPTSLERYSSARYRIVFEEFFYYQLSICQKQAQNKQVKTPHALRPHWQLSDQYLKALPYQLTAAQSTVVEEIKQDLTQSVPMNRLVQGDVGSGKTDVAVLTLLQALDNQKKGAIMAPTEILAQQHYLKFRAILEPLGVRVVLLKSKLKKSDRKQILDQVAEPGPMVVVGTHALIQDTVEISQLAVAVIDEQHRFGVRQRMQLSQKGFNPHCLYLTATPIPRTLMLTAYGDLDKSIISELPPGRKPPKTYFFEEKSLPKITNFCVGQIKEGRQVYFVFPLVEASEKLDLKAATESWERLQESVFKSYEVGLIHGRLTDTEKNAVMEKFRANEIQVLVATTVIEVGVDVPNATTMVVCHAERFGLSQLHQLRGRVGRGADQSHCFLVGNPKSEDSKKRLKAMLETHDGFKLAQYDLVIRGPGDILGTRQAGLPNFNLADLVKDEKILLTARKMAQDILQEDPNLLLPKYQVMKSAMGYFNELAYERGLN